MKQNRYEFHQYESPTFPVIFHYDIIKNQNINLHWHENIEILCFVNGEGIVMNGGETFKAKGSDIVVINANSIHNVQAVHDLVEYHCLIVDKHFCESIGIFTEDHFLQKKINDSLINSFFDSIVDEMMNKRRYYQTAVLSHISFMLAHLYRNYEDYGTQVLKNKHKKSEMVKEGLKFIKEHFDENISVDDIVNSIGFSKYYFLRTFKEITGDTVIHYLNNLKIQYAKNLIDEGKYSISEIALLCGFESQSYFTKVFKRYTGELPSRQGLK